MKTKKPYVSFAVLALVMTVFAGCPLVDFGSADDFTGCFGVTGTPQTAYTSFAGDWRLEYDWGCEYTVGYATVHLSGDPFGDDKSGSATVKTLQIDTENGGNDNWYAKQQSTGTWHEETRPHPFTPGETIHYLVMELDCEGTTRYDGREGGQGVGYNVSAGRCTMTAACSMEDDVLDGCWHICRPGPEWTDNLCFTEFDGW